MEALLQDIRLAVRLLRQQLGFSLLAISTLGLGIGGSTAIFSVIDAALLRPLPYPHPDRLVDIDVEMRQPDGRLFRVAPSVEDVRDWQEHSRAFSHLALWRTVIQPVVVDGPEPRRLRVREISEGYLDAFGVAPLLGRNVTQDDAREGAAPVVLIGYGFWLSRFGGDRDILGRVIRIDNTPVTVVGVLPPAFYRDSAIWRPFRLPTEMFARRGTGASIYGRLRPGVSLDQAREELDHLMSQRDWERGFTPAAIRLRSLYEVATSGGWPTAKVLSWAVGLILLIACVNVAGLLLARGAARRPELAIRAAIGAGRGRLVRQLVTESLVLAAAGGIVGLALAWVSLDALVANIPISLPVNSPVTVNPKVLAFAVLLSLATGVLFGLAPAISLSRVKLTDALAHADQRRGSALSRRAGQLLIAVEVTLAVVLLAGAGLMVRSLARVLAVDVGFDPASVVTLEVVPIDPGQAVLKDYYPALVQSIRELPSIEAVGAVDHLPLAGSSTMTRAVIDGAPRSVNIRQFLPGYFEAIGMSLRMGRFPGEEDRRAGVPVALLNQEAARQLYPDGSPVGRRFEVGSTTFDVVGVVSNVRHRGPLDPIVPEVYVSFGALEARPLIVVARPRGQMLMVSEQLRRSVHDMGTRAVVDRIRRGSDWLADRVVTPRRRTVLLGLLGGLGLLLALVGVFGTTTYAVTRRTREIGVRMAFGARPRDVVRTILSDAAWPLGLGILIGLGGATATTRVIASFLFETAPTDALTLFVVAAVLASTALVAAWVPARRAARVDPVAALRAE